jgi:hypothetical protein
MKWAGADFDAVEENEINTNRILDKNGGRTDEQKKGPELFFLSLSGVSLLPSTIF